MCNKDKPWFNDDCRRAFVLKQEAHRRWSRVNLDEFVHCQRANVIYAEPGRQFSVRSMDILMNAQCPHKWWSTLKSAVFGSSSDSALPPLIGGEGVVVSCVSLLERQSCCHHILIVSSPGIL